MQKSCLYPKGDSLSYLHLAKAERIPGKGLQQARSSRLVIFLVSKCFVYSFEKPCPHLPIFNAQPDYLDGSLPAPPPSFEELFILQAL